MQSTSSEATLTGAGTLKPGDRVSVTRHDGSVEVGYVQESEASSTFVKIGPTAVRRLRNMRMTAHRQLGHSFWPRRSQSPHRYECHRCGMEKEPGTMADMGCQDYLKFKVVQEVHNL